MGNDSALLAEMVACLDETRPQCCRRHHDRIGQPAEVSRLVAGSLAKAEITRIADITALDRIGIPVAIAVRPNSRSLSVSQGKGLDIAAAITSATMEALELAAAEALPANFRAASLDEVSATSTQMIDLGVSTRCQAREVGRADPLLWVDGHDLCSGGMVAVPWPLVGVDYRVNPPGFHPAFQVSTDGLASGRTYCEAIFHALCELIERDASALLEFSSPSAFLARTRKIAASDPPVIGELQQRIAAANCTLSITDMTTDVGVPCFTAVISDNIAPGDGPRTRYGHSGGCGCHPSIERALVRAITEAAQSRLTRITGSRDDLPLRLFEPPGEDAGSSFGEVLARLDDDARVATSPSSLVSHTSIPANIRGLVQRLQDVGLRQVIAVPIRNPFGIAVVRVIVPGLQTEITDGRGILGARALTGLLQGAP